MCLRVLSRIGDPYHVAGIYIAPNWGYLNEDGIPPVDSIMAMQDFWNSIFQFRRKESHANNCST